MNLCQGNNYYHYCFLHYHFFPTFPRLNFVLEMLWPLAFVMVFNFVFQDLVLLCMFVFFLVCLCYSCLLVFSCFRNGTFKWLFSQLVLFSAAHILFVIHSLHLSLNTPRAHFVVCWVILPNKCYLSHSVFNFGWHYSTFQRCSSFRLFLSGVFSPPIGKLLSF